MLNLKLHAQRTQYDIIHMTTNDAIKKILGKYSYILDACDVLVKGSRENVFILACGAMYKCNREVIIRQTLRISTPKGERIEERVLQILLSTSIPHTKVTASCYFLGELPEFEPTVMYKDWTIPSRTKIKAIINRCFYIAKEQPNANKP